MSRQLPLKITVLLLILTLCFSIGSALAFSAGDFNIDYTGGSVGGSGGGNYTTSGYSVPLDSD